MPQVSSKICYSQVDWSSFGFKATPLYSLVGCRTLMFKVFYLRHKTNLKDTAGKSHSFTKNFPIPKTISLNQTLITNNFNA